MWVFLDLVSLILEFLEILEFSGFWGLCQENLGNLVSCPFWGAEDLENLDVVSKAKTRILRIPGIHITYTNC